MTRYKVFLVLIHACIIAGSSVAQSKEKGDDVYGIPASPKKITENGKISLLDDNAFLIDDFVNGYVLLPSNIKRIGPVRFNGNVAIFNDTIADKTTRYSAKEIRGFVAMADTFSVYTDTTIVPPTPHMASFGDKLFIDKKFIKQLIYGERVCLYKTGEVQNTARLLTPMSLEAHAVFIGARLINGPVVKNTFYLKRRGEIQYTLIPKNRKDFKKIMAKYFRDNDAIVQAINGEKLAYEDIEEIINRYNKKS
ncbi:MAG: hypothetical protein V4592_04470 [Bacteroidota bacterium]